MTVRVRVLVTVGLLSLTVLLLQIVLSRVFTGLVYNSLYYFPLSMAMLGLCGGGVFLYVFEDRFSGEPEDIARRSIHRAFVASLLFAVLTLAINEVSRRSIDPSLIASRVSDPRLDFDSLFLRSRIPLLFAYGLASVLPFYFLGIAISVLLKGYARIVNTVYFFDLAGATLGAVLAVPVLNHLASANYLLTAPLLVALTLGIWERRGWIYLAVVLILFSGAQITDTPSLGGQTLRSLRYIPSKTIAIRWASPAYMQLLSPHGRRPPTIIQDHHATAYVEPFVQGQRGCALSEQRSCALAEWLRIAYTLRGAPESVLVLAAGVGQQMIEAWRMGVPAIEGIELNPFLVELAEEGAPEARIGDFLKLDGVRYEIDEARHHVRGTDRVFDLILLPPFGKGRGTATPIAPNHLLTEEAIAEYLARLSEEGLLVINVNRPWMTGNDDILARFVSLVRGGVERSGVGDPEAHVLALVPGYMLVSRRVFRPEELEQLDQRSRLRRRSLSDLESELERPRKRVDDDYPFWGSTLSVPEFARALTWPLRTADEAPTHWDVVALSNEFALILVLLIILLPLVRMRRVATRLGGRTGSTIAYFFCLGAGFMFVEIPLMEKMVFALGHPIYSISFSLGVLLASTGVGSLLSGRLLWSSSGIRQNRLRVAFLMLLGLQILLYVGVHPLVEATMGSSTGVQALVIGMAIVPLGLLLGMPFPQGIALLRDSGRLSLIPWAWGVNGGASVLAINLSIPLVRIFGVSPMFIVALALYAGAFALLNLALLPSADPRKE